MNRSITPLLLAAFALIAPWRIQAHSAPILTPAAPLHTEGRRLLDANQREFVLQGVQMSGLEALTPTDQQKRTVQAMTELTFRIIHQRWNMNAIRLPVSSTVWRRDGKDYLARLNQIVQRGNAEGLLAVLVATEEANDTGLPGTEIADFWTALATNFKDTGLVVFDLYARPLLKSGTSPAHTAAEWTLWRNGGTSSLTGSTVIGMQQLVDRIRATGAKQLIAAPAFHDSFDFQGFGPDFYIDDPNILYEVHPYFDHALTDAQRDLNFGFLAARFPLYAGEFGTPFFEDSPSCRSIPADILKASDAVAQLLAYMLFKSVSWTAAAFEPSQLITDFDTFAPTLLNRPWTCGQKATPQPGIGGMLILWQTGDPLGFGSIAPDQIASAAGGPAGPVVPGQVLMLYGQGVGPEVPASGAMDDTGKLATLLAGTEIRFDGISAPIYAADYYQVKVQVPYEVAGRESTKIQASQRGIPSNEITVPVADAAPGLFTYSSSLTDAVAANQDGTLNSPAHPAPAGSVVALFATGAGVLSPAIDTGRPATAPYSQPVQPATLTIAGQNAEILFYAAAPGLIGVIQINARIPATLPATDSAQLILAVGGRRPLTTVPIWVR